MALLDSLFQSQAAPEMMFDPEGRPIDPFYASTVGKPKKAPEFGAGAQPIQHAWPVAGMLAGMTGIEGANAPQQWQPPAPFADRPPTNDPTSFEPKVVTPLPTVPVNSVPKTEEVRPGDPLSINAADYRLPANAQPTEGTISGQSASPSQPEPSFLQNVGKKLLDPNNAAMWMAMGSGFSGAGSIGTGMRRAFGNAAPLVQQQVARNATIQALMKKGYSENDATAIASNKEALTHVLPQLFGGGTPTWGVIGQNAYGQPQYGWINPENQTVRPANTTSEPVKVGTNPSDTLKLPKGTVFVTPDGRVKVR